ncbi:MAG: hypothetical protein KH846_05855 [Leptotrichia wadei]|uniref:hypothetical protein n=1 Tax=Leptotrichia wadei TaxID=157687 RepID=UPI0026F194ED|nr:hypothetical protein [Leptotrichia wadei]MBS6019709.1 hypothetical protein [Leptotrichia wadei]
MIKFGNIKKEHLVGAAVGVGTVAVGYYLYKKNQSKVDSFLRKQGINIKTTKERLEDLIAEKELSTNTAVSETVVEVEEK